ncbi:unnamed protein product [Amoebophrya sp. A25]|nr:unnamed protein product [Amoebophrya sp. A25]|eukprot:GSA25T00001547001.1
MTHLLVAQQHSEEDAPLETRSQALAAAFGNRLMRKSLNNNSLRIAVDETNHAGGGGGTGSGGEERGAVDHEQADGTRSPSKQDERGGPILKQESRTTATTSGRTIDAEQQASMSTSSSNAPLSGPMHVHPTRSTQNSFNRPFVGEDGGVFLDPAGSHDFFGHRPTSPVVDSARGERSGLPLLYIDEERETSFVANAVGGEGGGEQQQQHGAGEQGNNHASGPPASASVNNKMEFLGQQQQQMGAHEAHSSGGMLTQQQQFGGPSPFGGTFNNSLGPFVGSGAPDVSIDTTSVSSTPGVGGGSKRATKGASILSSPDQHNRGAHFSALPHLNNMKSIGGSLTPTSSGMGQVQMQGQQMNQFQVVNGNQQLQQGYNHQTQMQQAQNQQPQHNRQMQNPPQLLHFSRPLVAPKLVGPGDDAFAGSNSSPGSPQQNNSTFMQPSPTRGAGAGRVNTGSGDGVGSTCAAQQSISDYLPTLLTSGDSQARPRSQCSR